jgi:hypothetical protein
MDELQKRANVASQFIADVHEALKDLPVEIREPGADMALDTIPKLIEDWKRLKAENEILRKIAGIEA